jgi:subtilisin family serine protease
VIHRAATETRGGLGAVVVFAAGNDDRELQDDEIEGLPDVLCVSALDSYGQPTAYTNSGASVDVAAPSATVTLTAGEGITTTFGGTSAAAPVVSGVAALALSIRPDLSAAELTALIIDTAQQSPIITPDEDGHHDVFGYGLIDPPSLAAALTGAGDTGEPADTAAPADPADSASGDEKGGCGCQSAEVSSLLPALAGLLLAGRRRLGWTLRLRPAIIRTPAEKDPEC